MFFLNATSPETIKLMRTAMVGIGFKAQRLAPTTCCAARRRQTAAPPATVGPAPVKEQVIHFVNKKMPAACPSAPRARCWTSRTSAYVPIIRDPKTTTADTEAVFYFPGCGSERLFSPGGPGHAGDALARRRADRAAAGYLCCGYPQRGSRASSTRPRR